MVSTVNNDFSSIVYRHVEKHEQQQALDLWYPIFKTNPGFYERYFTPEASPRYQEGDTLGAWYDEKLVSAVHIRRLILRSRDDNCEYLCGAIANVATRPEYQRQGLSRHLLRMAIGKMEKSNQFDISMLGTEQHNHYAALGWEQTLEPTEVAINWKHSSAVNNAQWRPVSDLSSQDMELLLKIHSNQPRVYQIDRSPAAMFEHWVGWEWQDEAALLCLWPNEGEQGYVLISKIESENHICVLEWRAPNIHIEQKLLSLAADEIRQRQPHTKVIRLHALPQYMNVDQLAEWAGAVTVGKNEDAMMRNIRLPNDVYDKIKAAYLNGNATFWSGDYF